ncbi:aminomethyl-transferring glycine dehydrogenase subunit GcvPB [Desulfolutivibrio sulfoxidireducens]|uniref:aminomethyl-transferring glycine dehydrogenase subunit GcvPB n=1 Tax=Desulfolutivibrio sulfoxidireducens TaxID=2773299 RepID=UPI00159E0675|nr:aminomethyl-transferring glycine dehydrogenase subunit GcvPB [Desulfolutivibrio sulfoxidireducens]QLA15866.1 aminotransferase class V-fold PLP-dependent enzyme [Desulfolutivibrio sulfoxidireducens]QLA20232.1 aminotransferase class V-fold PLP-dependent enzyme [Desulfolutivibrio sulfoxidireducens]
MKTVFDTSVPGREGVWPEKPRTEPVDFIPEGFLRPGRPNLPSLSELDVVRHFTRLSSKNYGVDSNFYPLGSCTMKYNPKFTEEVAALPGFSRLHPLLPQLPGGGDMAAGALEVLYETERLLCEITGMAAFTLHPMAGAHGELTGALMMAAYHADKGHAKTRIICPDSAHGTNPASAAIAGFEVVSIASKDGIIDPEALAAVLDDKVAGVMMTVPNTLGLFERHLPRIVELCRKVDALLYYDGANLNAILGKLRVGDAGFDVVHLNLHKTFATPHGGGGPGSGPVGVSERLIPFLPISRVFKDEAGRFGLRYDYPKSIGYVAPFYGNFGVVLKAYAYILRLGREGLPRVSEHAVLAANYLRKRLEDVLDVPFNRICMHEFVASAERQAKSGVRALDIAKALLDRGYHAPTIYFPLIVKEALMFEPTETESKDTLDAFVADLRDILALAETDPAAVTAAPVTLPVGRLDETHAARAMEITDDLG